MGQAKTSKPDDRTKIIDDLTSELAQYLLMEIRKQEARGVDVVQQDGSKKVMDYFNSQSEFRKRKDKLYRNDYSNPIVFKPLPGESDRATLLKGVPAPKSPEAALQADPKEHDYYKDKIDRFDAQMKEEARRKANKSDLMQTYNAGGEEAVKKKYMNEASKNDMIAEMGGVSNLEKMSDKEREAAARKMVANRTGGYTPEQIKKMTPEQKQALGRQMASNKMAAEGGEVLAAFMEEMRVNDSYRKRYEAMNDEQKQIEYRKFEERYYGGAVPENAGYKPRVDQKGADEAREIIRFNKWQEEYNKELQAQLEPVKSLSRKYESEWENAYAALGRWATATIDALPTVSDSEYGPRKDGLELVEMTIAIVTYMIDRDKISKQREIWDRYMRIYVDAVKKMDDFALSYDKRTDLPDQVILQVAALRSDAGPAMDMNKSAADLTRSAASIQLNYNCKVLKNCVDPRQDKR